MEGWEIEKLATKLGEMSREDLERLLAPLLSDLIKSTVNVQPFLVDLLSLRAITFTDKGTAVS